MDTSKHIKFWLAVIFAAVFLVPLYRTASDMEDFMRTEIQMTQSVFGVTVTKWLTTKAEIAYRLSPADKVGMAAVDAKGIERTKKASPGSGEAVVHGFNKYINGLVSQLYVAVMRLFNIMVWLAVLGPVFVAAVIDGFTQRAIKRSEFGAIRPAAFTVTSLMVVPLAMAPLFYMVSPIPISPLATPAWALVMAIPLSLMVSNMQPIFGKN